MRVVAEEDIRLLCDDLAHSVNHVLPYHDLPLAGANREIGDIAMRAHRLLDRVEPVAAGGRGVNLMLDDAPIRHQKLGAIVCIIALLMMRPPEKVRHLLGDG